MQKILDRQDSTLIALRTKVADALRGYENNGLTIVNKNGKIYVSLDEKLLFSSGSWQVDPKGVEALKKIAKVLENNTDINVMVEGHTDNVPYRGSGQIKDNWDLSVMRATAIVNVLVMNSKISPSRIIAAGRSEYIPVDVANTTEARAKNRRTEIILTPKLDKLFQIIESN
jgi:chemotaxis protein MotB